MRRWTFRGNLKIAVVWLITINLGYQLRPLLIVLEARALFAF